MRVASEVPVDLVYEEGTNSVFRRRDFLLEGQTLILYYSLVNRR
jgi:hypothetical protein